MSKKLCTPVLYNLRVLSFLHKRWSYDIWVYELLNTGLTLGKRGPSTWLSARRVGADGARASVCLSPFRDSRGSTRHVYRHPGVCGANIKRLVPSLTTASLMTLIWIANNVFRHKVSLVARERARGGDRAGSNALLLVPCVSPKYINSANALLVGQALFLLCLFVIMIVDCSRQICCCYHPLVLSEMMFGFDRALKVWPA